MARRYETYYSRINPWVARNLRLVSEGAVLMGEHTHDRDFLRSEYCNDFWKPLGFGDSLSCFFGIDAERMNNLLLVHPPRKRFRSEERRLLGSLASPLAATERARRRATDWQAALRQSHRLWDAVPYGALVLDRQGRVADANRQAHAILARLGVSVREGRLRAPLRDGEPVIRQLLRHAFDRRIPFETHLRFRGERSVEIRVLPESGSTVSVVVLLSDPTLAPTVDQAWVRAAYGLTAAEARVAALVAAGRDVAAICAEMAITEHTARGYLKQLLSKTGTSRQAELVSKLLGGLAAIKSDRAT